MTHRHTKQCGCAPQSLLDHWANPSRGPRNITPEDRERRRQHALAIGARGRQAELERHRREGPTEAQMAAHRLPKTDRQRESARQVIAAIAPRAWAAPRSEAQLEALRRAAATITPKSRRSRRRNAAVARRARIVRLREQGMTPAEREQWRAAQEAGHEARRGLTYTPSDKHRARLLRTLRRAQAVRYANLEGEQGHDDAVCASCGLVARHPWTLAQRPCTRCGAEVELVPHEPGPDYLTTGCAKPQARA